MVNINKLKGKIVENGLTIEKLADNIGIDRSTLYRKINNNGETFTIKEADLILNALNLTAEEAKAIFFSQFVA
ncbi:MAG: helix-turn-helix transcriptional regulator [Syntrophomonadaceae bacterium]